MNCQTFFTTWIARRVALEQISAATAEGYACTLAPFFVAHRTRNIASLSASDIEDFYIARLKVVASATLRGSHVLLKQLFNEARKKGLVAVNPLDDVDAPKAAAAGEKKALDCAQIRALLAYAADKPLLLRTVKLAIATGLRRGELAGLLWSCIDFDAGVIRVTRNIVKVSKTEIVSTPKSAAGVRQIALPADLLAELRKARGAPDAPVLRTQQGGRPSLAYLSEMLTSALRAIGCGDGFTLHSTRHTHATHLLRAGGSVKAVSVRLGHADTTVTMRTYAKVLNGDDADLARAIGNVLG